MPYDFSEQLRIGKAEEEKLDRLWGNARILDVSDDPAWQKQGIDRVLELSDGRRVPVEYKADFIAHRTGNLIFELVSVDTTGTPGWGLTSRADYLVYLIAKTDEVYFIRLPDLRQWVLSRKSEFREVAADNGGYRTISLLVPLHRLEQLSFVKKLSLKSMRLNLP